MNNEPFHVMSQEWRYFSRQKSLIHTLHLAQLAPDLPGETVLILPTAPEKSGDGWHPPVPPLPGGTFGGSGKIITNTGLILDCYGSVSYNGTITAQNKMDITVGPLGATEKIITMMPTESGFFMVHVEGQSDLHMFGYQGIAGDGKITVQIFDGGIGGVPKAFNDYQVLMSGPDWSGTQYLDSLLRTSCDVIFYTGGPIFGRGLNLGDGTLSMWAMKIAD